MIALLARAFALVVLGVLLGYTQNALRGSGVSLEYVEAPASCGGETLVAHPVGEIRGAAAALALGAATREASPILVLDARTPAAYEQGHLDGSLHLPCAAGSADAEHIVAIAAAYPNVWVYGASDEEARTVADELAHRLPAGASVRVILGGFDALQRAGAPAASGPCERCLTPGERL
jgi:rhodanese-related sulfurtransferase